jgi:hypothetical protein
VCNGHPVFPAGKRHASVSATVSDQISGPASPIVSVHANTSRVGVHHADLQGSNNAGFTLQTICSYTVQPINLNTTPTVTAQFTAAQRHDGEAPGRKQGPPAAVLNLTCAWGGCPFSSARRAPLRGTRHAWSVRVWTRARPDSSRAGSRSITRLNPTCERRRRSDTAAMEGMLR